MAISIDPVCGMELTPGQIEAQAQYQGKRYDFCSEEGRRLFEANPQEYVNASTDTSKETVPPISNQELTVRCRPRCVAATYYGAH